MIDIDTKTIIIGTGDVIFIEDPSGNIEVHQIDPIGKPGEPVYTDWDPSRNSIGTVTVPYNENFMELRTECKRLIQTRETGDDMSRYAMGPPLMLGEWKIEFNDMKFNYASLRVLIEVLRLAMCMRYSLCAT